MGIKMIKGYWLPWKEEPSEVILEDGDWAYPEHMIERIKSCDKDGITFYFPLPMTEEQVREYEPLLFDESLGYKLIRV